jgi:plastocyanin
LRRAAETMREEARRPATTASPRADRPRRSLRDDEFVPSTATIAVGDVDLVNEGESPHNFTIEGQRVDVDVDPGTTTTQSIDLAAGTYTIFCAFHRSDGMQGSLTVEG